MFGVKESRQPIKGEFAKKLIEELQRILKLKKEKCTKILRRKI